MHKAQTAQYPSRTKNCSKRKLVFLFGFLPARRPVCVFRTGRSHSRLRSANGQVGAVGCTVLWYVCLNFGNFVLSLF